MSTSGPLRAVGLDGVDAQSIAAAVGDDAPDRACLPPIFTPYATSTLLKRPNVLACALAHTGAAAPVLRPAGVGGSRGEIVGRFGRREQLNRAAAQVVYDEARLLQRGDNQAVSAVAAG